MNARENLEAVLEGRTPDCIPFSINHDDFVTDDPAWGPLFERGLCPVRTVRPAIRKTTPHCQWTETDETWRRAAAKRLTLHTPVGSVSQLSVQGWVEEYFLKSAADYRVMEYMVRDTRLEQDPRLFEALEAQAGDPSLVCIALGRSPMQTILVDWAGLDRFPQHLAERLPEADALAVALFDKLMECTELVAKSPGRYVQLNENVTTEPWGAGGFAKYHVPVYDQVSTILHRAGKKLLAHCDGRLAALTGQIALTRIDCIESLTPPPGGDLTLAAARAAWPDKVLWANLNVSLYGLPPNALARTVQEMARQGAPDGRGLAFEVAEGLPANWRESLPVVLDALSALRR